MPAMAEVKGKIIRISGPVIEADHMRGAKMYDVVRVGKENLIGEIIRLQQNNAIIQVYEDTNGLLPGEEVISTGMPLSVELGPGLITNIYDGIQRPLPAIHNATGDFIARGVEADALDKKKKWEFKPTAKKGDKVQGGDILGEVEETSIITHRVMVSHSIKGTIKSIVNKGKYTITEDIAVISTKDGDKRVQMLQRWPVRTPRPVAKKYDPTLPLVTGQRVIDTFFPVAKGGTAAIPGGFGTGKCVTPDTPIVLTDGNIVTMKEVYDTYKAMGECYIGRNESYTLLHHQEIPVFSYGNRRLQNGSAQAVYKGKTDCIYKITTRTGKVAKITPDHKLLTINSLMNVSEKPSKELQIGDFLVMPRKIYIKGTRQTIPVEKIFAEQRIADEKLLLKIPNLIKQATQVVGTKKALAQKLGVSYDVLIGYYLKKNTPTIQFLTKISSFLHINLPIKKVKGCTTSQKITVPRNIDERFAEFLGYIIGDGCIKKGGQIFFSNNDVHLRHRFNQLVYELFDIQATEGKDHTVHYSTINNRILLKLLISLGIPCVKKSNHCSVPTVILKSPDSIITRFVSAYFNCDGYVGGNGKELEIVTASKQMHINLSYLLLRIGVIHTLREKRVAKKPYYRTFIRGKNEITKFYMACRDPSLKFEKIKRYISDGKRTYTCIDILPASSCYLESLYTDMVRPHGMLEDIGVNTLNYFGQINQEHMSASTFQKFSSISDNPKTKVITDELEDFFYDRIVKIEKINKPTDVYDITVPTYHNFIGGFGPMMLHNTVTLHQLAKWSDAKIVVYVGCGERGNEMTDVLREFPELEDPTTGEPLMNRTVLIANTSNMPVAARDASVYTGMTLAEYYRDMGYDVALMADSTSRLAEAMREISGRLEEMPGEEGYPAYLASRLAEFYERSGRVKLLSTKDREGSVSVMGAVSPPGGDFSEPVAQNTLRIVKVFWALDSNLADKRHFPSVNWLKSYSLYLNEVKNWWHDKTGPDWLQLRNRAMALLQKESELQEIVKLVGPDAIPPRERGTLESAKMIREDFLQQSAFHKVDTFCPSKKQYEMLRIMMKYADLVQEAVSKHVHIDDLITMKARERIARMKIISNDTFEKQFNKIENELQKEVQNLISKGEGNA